MLASAFESSRSPPHQVQTRRLGEDVVSRAIGRCFENGSKSSTGGSSILGSGLVRALVSSTLYIEDPMFHTLFSKETGNRYMGPQLSLFRLYMGNQDEFRDIWQVIIWLDIMIFPDNRGVGDGYFGVLSKSGIGSGMAHQIWQVLF